VIAHSALADGPAAAPNAIRHQTPLAFLRLTARAGLDGLGRLVGRDHPGAARRPTRHGSAPSPPTLNGDRAFNPYNAYPNWP
jgi:hypothetical protein